jgi:hypothetical protein
VQVAHQQALKIMGAQPTTPFAPIIKMLNDMQSSFRQ